MAELSFRLIEVEPGSKLECERELHSKGHCYAAQDRRRQYLVLGQRVAAIRDIIREVVGEDVKLSSLYEAAAHELKRGYHYSFKVEKLKLSQLPDFTESLGGRYERVLVAAAQPGAWKVLPNTAVA